MELSQGERAGKVPQTRADGMQARHRLQASAVTFLTLIVAVIFALAGPQATILKEPSFGSGEGIDLVNNVGGWGHAFRFVNLYSNSLALSFDINANTSALDSRVTTRDVRLWLEWAGVDEDGNLSLFRNGTIDRSITCVKIADVAQCSRVLIFMDHYVTFERYDFRVRILPQDRDRAKFIESVDFLFEFENLKFAIWEIRLTYFCFGISVLASLWWLFLCRADFQRFQASKGRIDGLAGSRSVASSVARSLCCGLLCCKANKSGESCPYRTPRQRWMLALLVGLMLYNQPFYGMEYVPDATVRRIFVLISTMFQLGFASVLIVFWLCEFEYLYKGEQSRKSLSIKLVVVAVFWTGATVLYSRLISRQIADRMYNYYDDMELFGEGVVFLIASAVVLGFWLLYTVVRAIGISKAMDDNQRFLLVFHTLHLALFILGIASGAFFFKDPRHSQFTFLFQFMANFYVLELVYLFSPVSLFATTQDSASGEVSQTSEQHIEFTEVPLQSRNQV